MAFPFHESHTGALHPWEGHTGAFPSILGEAILVPPPPSLGRPLMAFPFHESHTGALHPWEGHTGAFPSILGKAPRGLPLPPWEGP